MLTSTMNLQVKKRFLMYADRAKDTFKLTQRGEKDAGVGCQLRIVAGWCAATVIYDAPVALVL